MGIVNLHIVSMDDTSLRIRQAQIAREEKLAEDHRRGKHPWGSMRRDCSLCRADK